MAIRSHSISPIGIILLTIMTVLLLTEIHASPITSSLSSSPHQKNQKIDINVDYDEDNCNYKDTDGKPVIILVYMYEEIVKQVQVPSFSVPLFNYGLALILISMVLLVLGGEHEETERKEGGEKDGLLYETTTMEKEEQLPLYSPEQEMSK